MLVFVGKMEAQTAVSIPYTMSFEEADSLELQNWVLNNGTLAASCKDKWMVGTDTKSEGKRSLYISDNDTTAHFGKARNIQFVYRDFILPKGYYIVSFDWKCMGAAKASFYAGFGPPANLPCEAITTGKTDTLPATYNSTHPQSTSQLKGQRYWQNAQFQVNSNGTRPVRIYFAWCSQNSDTTLMNPLGACIDNIQISKANCAPPTSLNVTPSCDTTIVTWEGTSGLYQVGYRRIGDEHWHTRSGLSAPMGTGTIGFEGLEEGLYDFRVRGICGTDTSVYTYKSSVVIFCPAAHCINYVGLHETDGTVICRYGHINSSGVIDANDVGVIDYGPDDVASRHTVCWDIDAYDQRTHNMLPCVPEGELASVRLGNWDDGGEWESITYNYYVDSAYSIILLKYAVVLEDPDHPVADQPRFTLSIKDQNGNEVDATCGSADFHAGDKSGNKGSGWHYDSDVTWKEWTTYGVDLTPYIGQTLQVSVATYDCTWQGHYGYGYFCLGCSAAKIVGVSCGDDSKMTAQAPEGFLYSWSPISDLTRVVSTDRTLEVDASDTTTYRCRLIYKDQANCHFDLYSSVFPRFPVADFAYKYEPNNCENRVVFRNHSHIMVKYEGDTTGTHHYDEECDEYEWVINNERFSDKNPVYVFPEEGGTYPVHLFASISGKCMDDTVVYITLPKIGNVHLQLTDSICYGSTLIFGEEVLSESGVYTQTFKSRAGCDSVCTMDLTVLPQSITTLPDTAICAETKFTIDGDTYPYDYSRSWVRKLINSHGCDSTVVINNVTLLDTIKPEIEVVQDIVEDGDLGIFAISGEGYSYYTVNGVVHTEDTLWNLEPDTYLMIFYNDHGCEKAKTLTLKPGCLGKMVYQRWNDVLSIKNPEYAEGRSFAKYQWMKNGVEIPGATKSYYYAGWYPDIEPTGHLDINAYYEVIVVGDSLPGTEWQITCPYHPIQLVDGTAIDYIGEDMSLAPSFVRSRGQLWLQTTEPVHVVCYSTSGMLVFSTDAEAGRTAIEAPAMPGMYVVTVFSNRSKKTFKVCVTE